SSRVYTNPPDSCPTCARKADMRTRVVMSNSAHAALMWGNHSMDFAALRPVACWNVCRVNHAKLEGFAGGSFGGNGTLGGLEIAGEASLFDVPGGNSGNDGSEGDVLDDFGSDSGPNIERKKADSLDSIVRGCQ